MDNDICKTIWENWQKWHHVQDIEFEEIWYGYETMSEETRIDIKMLKNFMKTMRDHGIGYHGPCVNDEYIPAGSGNFIYEEYRDKTWSEIECIISRGE